VNGALVTKPKSCWGCWIVLIWEARKFLFDVMGITMQFFFLLIRKIDEHALCGCSECIAEREWLDELACNFSRLCVNGCVCTSNLVECWWREKKSLILYWIDLVQGYETVHHWSHYIADTADYWWKLFCLLKLRRSSQFALNLNLDDLSINFNI